MMILKIYNVEVLVEVVVVICGSLVYFRGVKSYLSLSRIALSCVQTGLLRPGRLTEVLHITCLRYKQVPKAFLKAKQSPLLVQYELSLI